MAFLLNFLLRLLLLAAGLVFALSLAFAFLVLFAVWGVRMAWARLTGRPVTPFAMRFGPRQAFEEMARRAASAAPPASATSAAQVLPCVSLPPNPPPMRGDCTTTLFRGMWSTCDTLAWTSDGCCVDEHTKTSPSSPRSAQTACVSR